MPRVLPAGGMSPSMCAWIADGAEEAISYLEAYGLPVPPQHPLRRAIPLLRAVAKRGSYGGQAEIEAVVHAILVVRDFHQIGRALTESPVTSIQAELADAVRTGTMSRRADDVRSQFWFGAMLAHGGLRPGVPPVPDLAAPPRRPDFICRADDMDISVEVKRPENIESAFKAIKAAASQIRDYGNRPGVIAVDIGAATGADGYVTAFMDSGFSPAAEYRERFRRAASSLVDRVSGLVPHGRFSRILGLFIFARVAGFRRSDSRGPEGAVFVEAPRFIESCGGLLVDTGIRVRRQMLSGLSSVSGSPVVPG